MLTYLQDFLPKIPLLNLNIDAKKPNANDSHSPPSWGLLFLTFVWPELDRISIVLSQGSGQYARQGMRPAGLL